MNPKTTNETESEFSVAVVSSPTFPLPMERPKEIFPTETKASAKPARYKPLPFDRERVFSQDPTLCMHWLNLPMHDGLLYVSQVYQQIKAMVDAYQLDHTDAFYEQYSDLLQAVLSDSEKEHPENLTTNYLRMKHKVFDKRLAHLLWHYENAMLMLEGSLANLCIMANINGPGRFKDFGVACKVSYINTRSNRYGQFPKPVGSENFVTSYSKFAAGKTFNGATFVSFPQWITDIYGNRGQHSFNASDLAAAFAVTGGQAYQFDQNAADYETMMQLYNNMYTTMQLFGMDVTRGTKHLSALSNKLDPKNRATAIPSTPILENGCEVTFNTHFNTDNDENSARSVAYKMNYSGAGYEEAFSVVKDGEGNDVKHDNIISRAWDTFLYWSAYAEEYFSAFAMPTSQIHELFTKLGYLEKSKSNVQFFGEINVDYVFDALDLRRDMIYKKDNKVNTATVVKWMPIIDKEGGTAFGNDFDRNFNRYEVDSDDAFTVIKKAEEYPSLTPTIFHEVSDDSTGGMMPYVANAVGSASTLMDKNGSTYPAASVLGRYASLFDLACCSNIDPSADWIDTIAIDPDVAKEFIKRNDGIIIKERPTSPRVFTQPLIDCTDLYQCGFNVVIAHNSKTQNEFELWFKDPANYFKGNPSAGIVPGFAPAGEAVDGKIYPHVPSWGVSTVSGDKYLLENRVLSQGYLDLIKHAVVFVGDAIFLGPQLTSCKIASGNYAELIRQQQGTFISVAVIGNFNNMSPDPTADLPDDETIESAIVKSMALAACFNDPKLAMPDMASEYKSLKEDICQMANPDDNDPQALELRQYTFSPAYGSVLPVMYDIPDCGLLPTMGYEGNHYAIDNRDPNCCYGPKQYVANALAGNTINTAEHNTGTDFRESQVKSYIDYDSRYSAGQFLLWFIDRFQFKKLYTVGRQIYCYEDVVKLPGFSSPAKTFLSLLQRGIVFWNGVEDTLFLYNIPDERKHQRNPSWGSIGQIDFGGLIRLPVVKNKTLKGNRLDFTKSKPDNLSTEQSAALKGNPQSTYGSSKGGSKHHGKRPNKSKKRFNKSDKDDKRNRENEFDPSDKSIDDKTKFEDNKTVTKLMNEVNSGLQA